MENLVHGQKFDEGIRRSITKPLELDPNFPGAHYFLGRAYEAKRMYDQAVEEYTKSAALGGTPPDALKSMREIYQKSGWKAYLQMHLDLLVTRQQSPPFLIATVYARLGRKDETIILVGERLRRARLSLDAARRCV